MDRWMDEWMHGWMDAWMDGYLGLEDRIIELRRGYRIYVNFRKNSILGRGKS